MMQLRRPTNVAKIDCCPVSNVAELTLVIWIYKSQDTESYNGKPDVFVDNSLIF